MNLLQNNGAQPQKPPKYVPIFVDKMFTGIWTQRSVLHDPSDIATARFYGGRPDALWQGSNVELTNRLTLQRRPGLTPFSTAIYPTPPDRAFSFELTNGTIQVIVDTGSTPTFNMSIVQVISGVAYYYFQNVQNCAANDAYEGLIFSVSSYLDKTNNGSFTCVGSTKQYLILDNPNAVNDSTNGYAVSSGAVYYDTQGQASASYSFIQIENPLSDSGNFSAVTGFDPMAVYFNGEAEPSISGTLCGSYYSGQTWENDQISTITIGSLNANGQAGCVLRASTSSNFYLLQLLGPTGSAETHTISAFVSGVQHNLQTFSATVNIGDVWAFEVQGSVLSVYQNGTQVISYTDSVYSSAIASGAPGLFGYGTFGPSEAQISNWQGANVKEMLFAKSAGAGQTGFVAVAGTLYMGDGVDTRKYTPMNTNGTIWNYSIAAPTAQPDVTTVESGSAAVAWQASTFYSTMGLLVDGNGNIEFLTGVNNSGTNTTQYGTAGQGQPVWSNVTGVGPISGVDGTCHWLCAGPLALWTSNTKYSAFQCIYVPGVGGTPVPPGASGRGVTFSGTTGGGIFQTSGGTSGTSVPKWSPTTNTHCNDNGMTWQYLGPALLWQPNHTYNSWWEFFQNCIVEPSLPNATLIAAGTQQIYVQTNNNSSTGSTNTPGTSGSGYTPPWPLAANANPSSVGQTTGDGDLQWICLGWGTWLANTEYTAWTAGATQFSAIKDGNGNFQVCIQGGLSGGTVPYNGWESSTHYNNGAQIVVKSSPGTQVLFTVTAPGTTASTEPTVWNFTSGATTVSGGVTFTSNGQTSATYWGQTYGSQTTDGEVIWTNVGSAIDSTWVSDVQWYYPAVGFAAPTSSQAYGGSQVIADGDVQIVISSGLSSSSEPHFGAIGTTTQDNQAIWYTDAAQSANSLSWENGYTYAYSYKARSLTDFYSIPSYVTTGPGQSTLTIPIPPGLTSALPNPPSGSQTGGISTASPPFVITGSNSGAVNFVKVTGSLDPAVDTIVIWRSPDTANGVDSMLELTEIPNPLPVNGAPGVSVFADFLPDVATTGSNGVQYPGLNPLIAAPIDDQNDPPPSNFIPMVYNFQRIFGSSGQQVAWSGGPDITNGSNAQEAYLPSDNFPYLANVTRVIKNSQGLVVFLTDSVEFLGGGPATNSFYTVSLAPGIGMNNFNAADLYAGEIIFFSSDSQLKSINPSLQLANLGFPIGDQLALWDSSTAAVAYLQSGTDTGFYVSNSTTGWWRCNPHQVAGGISGSDVVWSPFGTVTGGAGMVQAVETSPGIKRLLVGGTGCNQQILQRNLDVFTDNGTPYDAWFVMGAIGLASQGQLAILKHFAMDVSSGFTPTVSVLLDEISGTFTEMSNPVFDPPSLYGTTITPSSYQPLRYYFAQVNSIPSRCRHIQIRVDLGSGSDPSEVFNMELFGKLMIET